VNKIFGIILFVISAHAVFSQDRIFLEQLPYDCKMMLTTDTNLREKSFVIDSTFGEEHNYHLYRKEPEVFAYTQKSSGKLVILKIWQVPQSWETVGVSIGMSQSDLVSLLKNQKIPFSKKNFRITNYVHVKWKKLQYEFSFPTIDHTDIAYPQYRDQLHYVVVRVIDFSNKASRGDKAVF